MFLYSKENALSKELCKSFIDTSLAGQVYPEKHELAGQQIAVTLP